MKRNKLEDIESFYVERYIKTIKDAEQLVQNILHNGFKITGIEKESFDNKNSPNLVTFKKCIDAPLDFPIQRTYLRAGTYITFIDVLSVDKAILKIYNQREEINEYLKRWNEKNKCLL